MSDEDGNGMETTEYFPGVKSSDQRAREVNPETEADKTLSLAEIEQQFSQKLKAKTKPLFEKLAEIADTMKHDDVPRTVVPGMRPGNRTVTLPGEVVSGRFLENDFSFHSVLYYDRKKGEILTGIPQLRSLVVDLNKDRKPFLKLDLKLGAENVEKIRLSFESPKLGAHIDDHWTLEDLAKRNLTEEKRNTTKGGRGRLITLDRIIPRPVTGAYLEFDLGEKPTLTVGWGRTRLKPDGFTTTFVYESAITKDGSSSGYYKRGLTPQQDKTIRNLDENGRLENELHGDEVYNLLEEVLTLLPSTSKQGNEDQTA